MCQLSDIPIPRPPGSARVILVGDVPTEETAAGRGVAVARVPNYLAAIGRLGTCGGDIVIGPCHSEIESVQATVSAIRDVAPEVKLMIATEVGDEAAAEPWVEAGADEQVAVPVVVPTTGASQPTPVPLPPPTPQASHQASEPIAEVEEDDSPPGDVDLVDAVLSGVDGVHDLALRVVGMRSEIAGVRYVTRPDVLESNAGTCQIRYRGVPYGYLTAPAPATNQMLAPWAGWLGHWLALDDQMRQLKNLAMRDELTGAWNRRYFNRFLTRILLRAAEDRSQVTLLVFDIDDFKMYNDAYGHAAGDEILRETARMMQGVVREHDVVARIGGDEFAVIFWDAEGKRRPNSQHPDGVTSAARRFQEAIYKHNFPKLLHEAPGSLTISGGLASFPWDGQTPDQLLERADAMALQSKRQGKNVISFGSGAERTCNGG